MILMTLYDKRIGQSGIKVGSSTPTLEMEYKDYWTQKDEEFNKKNDRWILFWELGNLNI